MSLGHHHAGLPPGHLRPPDDLHDARSINGYSRFLSGSRTPQMRASADADGSHAGGLISDADIAGDEDPRIPIFRELYKRSEAQINALFANQQSAEDARRDAVADSDEPQANTQRADEPALPPAPPKKPARKLDDDDDYDEYDDDDDDDEEDAAPPPKPKSLGPSQAASSFPSPSRPFGGSVSVLPDAPKEVKKETLEDIRKKLEEDKRATEEAARRSFHTLFYTLENDRDAMLDQQRLEESERQVEAEMSGQANAGNNANPNSNGYGSLSNANLGASSLTLKNLIARIDMKRTMVQASDAELRSLMSEVRKNRSKWASEDKIGQEELYEAAEKVLSELKAMTEHSSAFLTRVNKRDAPDYYTIIKHPMDLGTMTKKLKALQYKSKQEFVDDINLIWSNCFKYNTNPEHFLRKHALYMKKETEKLVPLIPEIIIRDRVEVEAEERRLQMAELDGAEESDDEPIMSSRGRKAPGKSSSKKGTAPVRNTPSGSEPPGGQAPQPPGPVRSDSDAALEGTQNGFATPPPGTLTPSDPLGVGAGLPGSQGDAMEIDGLITSSTALSALPASGVEFEDPEYKVWKQVTKKDRAVIAAERHRLFKGDKLNSEEPALLRTKAGMRRWLRNQQQSSAEGDKTRELAAQGPSTASATLAEGIEVDEDRVIPDYYDVMSGVPDLPAQLFWKEDSDGNIVDASEDFLRILPKGSFTQPDSKLARKMDANMRQMQETRKVCSKVGIVKQMQLQSQMYQNQFQKYQPEPFVEQDVPAHVMNDGGPVIAPWVCRAALQRSVAKVFYHTGFEEYQPSALEAVTDVASDFFQKIGETLKSYMEIPKVPATETAAEATTAPQWKRAYTEPEIVLHTLASVGIDVEGLESYIKDDVERLGTKLSTVHDRLRSLLSELLRPALADGGEDGSNAFHDGSEQFVGGDFAEDIDEDFFGFKELGLDREFGLATLSVPLHLLQNRMYNAAQAQNTSAAQTVTLFAPPASYPRITSETLPSQIGLVQGFFSSKLQTSNNEPLVEDLELPPKQRPMAARPRLPASGKIPPPSAPSGPTTSPQKRTLPPSASGQPAGKPGTEPSKKKLKKNSGVALGADGEDAAANPDSTKAANPADAKTAAADESSTADASIKPEGDQSAGQAGAAGDSSAAAGTSKNNDSATALPNGTADEAS
ncbi:hypothetical protein BO71DRAFT_355600 [Aspergillus ellipticus CBS 707.79]|uniref:SAGA complex subunit Spt7 n=1 Tax=Aspergillus ellipticus CBS 707.79 TaxID=1448320 RepID=A0A319D7L1_9EURO|nr:hypothetical protein BO71DRAFT_355600 [Aspergillus ellipticus CBS 707.79]